MQVCAWFVCNYISWHCRDIAGLLSVRTSHRLFFNFLSSAVLCTVPRQIVLNISRYSDFISVWCWCTHDSVFFFFFCTVTSILTEKTNVSIVYCRKTNFWIIYKSKTHYKQITKFHIAANFYLNPATCNILN